MSAESRTDVKHGVCKQCSRRRILWLPASICERCLLRSLDALGRTVEP